MKLEDKVMAVLTSAMAEIQRAEWKNRDNGERLFAEGQHSAWRILSKIYDDYAEQKARRNPIWRWRVEMAYKKSSKAIRKLKI